VTVTIPSEPDLIPYKVALEYCARKFIKRSGAAIVKLVIASVLLLSPACMSDKADVALFSETVSILKDLLLLLV
jgi:hypothetical protein